ncbi:MAG: hypothetical protein AB8G15_06095, partial [Saprospiraceae bacterium]
ENIFSINFEYDYLKRIRKTIDTNQCLFYNHKSKRYSWISQQEANGLINSNNPSDFIKRKLRSNDN